MFFFLSGELMWQGIVFVLKSPWTDREMTSGRLQPLTSILNLKYTYSQLTLIQM